MSHKESGKQATEKPILLNFVNLSRNFCPTLSEKTDFYFSLGPVPLNLHFLRILVFEESHLLL